MKLSVVVLASGNSKRFKENKLLYEIDKKPMYLHTAEKLINLKRKCENIDEIIFVTKYEKIIKDLQNKDIKVIENNNSEFGISQSIKLGISNSKNKAYMFIVCDQPYIKESTIENFVIKFIKSGKSLGCVSSDNTLLNPTIFTEKYKDDLMALEGDRGGKKIILNNLDDLFVFEVENPRELEDIDYKSQIEE